MIALRILDIKKFMAAFLLGADLDDYTLIEASITTFCTFTIDGRIEADFFRDPSEESSEEKKPPVEYIRWKLVRERCFDLIRGKRTPLAFKFIFFYPPEQLKEFLKREDLTVDPALVAGLCINLRFDGTNLLITTGTSMKSFTADRSADAAWDRIVLTLLDTMGVRTEQL